MTIAIAQGFAEELTLPSNTPTATVGSITSSATGSAYLCVIRAYSPSVTAVTDTFSNSYSLIAGPLANGSTSIYAYLATNGAGGASQRPTITQTSGDLVSVSYSEITGGATSSLLDGSASSVLDAASPFDSTVTTSNAIDLIIGVGGSNSSSTTVTYTPGGSFSLASSSTWATGTNVLSLGIMSLRATSTGTYGPNFTTSSGNNAAVITFALKELVSASSTASISWVRA